MYAFGEDGRGFFPAPTVFEEEFRRRYNVRVVGRSKTVRQQFYAISVDQRLHHPAVMVPRRFFRRLPAHGATGDCRASARATAPKPP